MSIVPQRIARFGAVGITAALLYLAGVFVLTTTFHASPAVASMLAYALAGAFSYGAQRAFTFASTGRHRVEAPRFLALSAAGLAICGALPAVLTQGLHLPPLVAVAAACIAVPALNYLVMERAIFTPPTAPQLVGEERL